MVRVLVVDDHPVVRHGICHMLADEADLDVVGEAHDGAAAIDLALALRPDVITMDLHLPDMPGHEAMERILERAERTADWRPQLIALSASADEESVLNAIEAGACGYLVKSSSRDEIAHAVRTAARGESVFASSIASVLAKQVRRYAPARSLSSRESAVLQLMAKGLTNGQIADHMVLERSTVKSHVEHILQKLQASNRMQAVARARDIGLVR